MDIINFFELIRMAVFLIIPIGIGIFLIISDIKNESGHRTFGIIILIIMAFIILGGLSGPTHIRLY